MKNSLRIHKWTHNEFNIFILGVLTRPRFSRILYKNLKIEKGRNSLSYTPLSIFYLRLSMSVSFDLLENKPY